jgi:hypothetical protein
MQPGQRSSSVVWQHRHHLLICRASRQEREVDWDPATPDAAAQQPSSLASASVSAEISDNGASQSIDESAQLIGEDGVEVLKAVHLSVML